MKHRFRHTEEHEADADAGAEEHGEPGQAAVVRLAIVRPQSDLAEARHRHVEGENEKDRDAQHVEPPERLDDPRLNRVEDRCRYVGQEHAECGDQQYERCRNTEHDRVNHRARARLVGRGVLRVDGRVHNDSGG